MSPTFPPWLSDKTALVVGDNQSSDIVAKSLANHGARIVRANIAASIDDAVAQLTAATHALGAPLSIVVHGPGPDTPDSPAHDLTPADFRASLMGNFDSRFFYASAMARHLIATKSTGSILFIARPERQGSAASAAGGGALGNLTKTLAVEWARDGIRTNTITTRFADGEVPENAANSLGSLAAYISSDYGAYITGCLTGIDETVA